MWSGQISIRLAEIDGSTVRIEITTPAGVMEVLAEASFQGDALHLDEAHVDGLKPGACGPGIYEIAREMRKVCGVKRIFVQGAVRTTGAGKGRRPKALVLSLRLNFFC